jgi:RNA polymerase sigma-70 factor (ECF subfamily)
VRSTSSDPLVDHLFRARAGQMVAWLARVFGPAHLELAEEVVQDALVKALQQWPHAGVPENPAGWLMRVARNGAIDALRRHASFRDRLPAVEAELYRDVPADTAADETIGDDELRMVFLCCHPSLPPDARVALSLKVACGFSVREIARAFLASEATIAQRLVRAKRALRAEGITLDLPGGADLAARLDAVLEVVYLLFNEGYKAEGGDDLIRVELCREALRLGRALAASPRTATPAAHALVSLMAFQAARLDARVDADGEIVLLEDQDRSRWDARLIALGFAHLAMSAEGPRMSAYHAQAAIAAIHAGAPSAAATNWRAILAGYDDLMAIAPSPVVALNRAIALSKTDGAAAGLAAVEAVEDAPELAGYHLLWSVKGRLLAEAGRIHEARACYARALALPCSEPERRFLERRAAAL